MFSAYGSLWSRYVYERKDKLYSGISGIPEICSRLIQLGTNVKWYIIGFGSDEDLIKQKIKQWNMERHVIILGKKENPYPYIKECDLYVQPSRYEGKSVTVREAQILAKPVVITNYKTADSQLQRNIDGIVVSLNNVECASEISLFLNNKKKYNDIISNLFS